ncbi:MAG: DUF4492 domain-containing protein [Bacteroidales bacterium]|nr:DUF4492 domain-containing protein [Bacteroidales bacterium]
MIKLLKRVYYFYLEGFKSMTIGKTLWLVIAIKLSIMFFILKPLFFKNELSKFQTPQEKSKHVIEQITQKTEL